MYTTLPYEQTEPMGHGEHEAAPSIEYSFVPQALGGEAGSRQ